MERKKRGNAIALIHAAHFKHTVRWLPFGSIPIHIHHSLKNEEIHDAAWHIKVNGKQNERVEDDDDDGNNGDSGHDDDYDDDENC